MSSWKQYGGTNNYERSGKINTDSISVNKIIYKEAFFGHLDVCGQIHANVGVFDTQLIVNGVSNLNGEVNIGSASSHTQNMNVYDDTIFYGTATFKGDFTTTNLTATNNVQLGNILYFDR